MDRWQPASRPPSNTRDVLIVVDEGCDEPRYMVGWFNNAGCNWICRGLSGYRAFSVLRWRELPPVPRSVLRDFKKKVK